jgi:hypothetical protein
LGLQFGLGSPCGGHASGFGQPHIYTDNYNYTDTYTDTDNYTDNYTWAHTSAHGQPYPQRQAWGEGGDLRR